MKDFLQKHSDGMIGAIIAFVVALLWMTLGFWSMLLLAIVAVIGFIIGSKRVRDAFKVTFKRVFRDDEK